MDKTLTKIIEKLNDKNINSLTIAEINIYYKHRLEDLLSNKKVLVKDELMYLLSETAPSNLRFDPKYLNLLLSNLTSVYEPLKTVPEIQKIKVLKEEAQSYIVANYNSNKTQKILINILKEYIKDIEIISTYPFIINGVINTIPVSCMIKNGEWVLPNPELFSFFRECQQNKKFPIIIAKKISGILFPVFKTLSVLGFNSYKAYLPEETLEIIESISSSNKNLLEIKYNNQFIFKKETSDEPPHEDINDALSNFFENIISKNIDLYYENFLDLKIKISNNFIDTVSQFKKDTSTDELLENYTITQKIIQGLRKQND